MVNDHLQSALNAMKGDRKCVGKVLRHIDISIHDKLKKVTAVARPTDFFLSDENLFLPSQKSSFYVNI